MSYSPSELMACVESFLGDPGAPSADGPGGEWVLGDTTWEEAAS